MIAPGASPGETKMCRYPMVKNFEDMFIRFDVIHERDRQTDGHRVTAKTAHMHMHRAVKTKLQQPVDHPIFHPFCDIYWFT